VEFLVSAFNTNVDAVVQVNMSDFFTHWSSFYHGSAPLEFPTGNLRTREELMRALIVAFRRGAAKEFLLSCPSPLDSTEPLHQILQSNFGENASLQMGGQAGIVGNTMALFDIGRVYVHAPSLSPLQTQLFFPHESLVASYDEGEGKWKQARNSLRASDSSMVHWIFEFQAEDVVVVEGESIRCPKSNRLIATYDPLNSRVERNAHFVEAVAHAIQNDAARREDAVIPHGIVFLSGFHLAFGENGVRDTNDAVADVEEWRAKGVIVHLEIASTPDPMVLMHIVDTIASKMDSMGLNDQELLDVLHVIGTSERDDKHHRNHRNHKDGRNQESRDLWNALCGPQGGCDDPLEMVPHWMQALEFLSEYTQCPRIQLHVFGMYMTILKDDQMDENGLRATKEGMLSASVVAASKALIGRLDDRNDLLASHLEMQHGNLHVSSLGEELIHALDASLTVRLGMIPSTLSENGYASFRSDRGKTMHIVAIPTILVRQPKSLVGLGDTISSVSLVGYIASRHRTQTFRMDGKK
jgi:ADP-dependent phosphofructokinase/glucokinase